MNIEKRKKQGRRDMFRSEVAEPKNLNNRVKENSTEKKRQKHLSED